jgi:hypothetical protein
MLDSEDYLGRVSDVGTASMQDTTSKRKGTHIEEIHKFEKYFKTAYNPKNLSFTLEEAIETLKEKIGR